MDEGDGALNPTRIMYAELDELSTSYTVGVFAESADGAPLESGKVTGIDIDAAAKKVYFVQDKTSSVYRCDLDDGASCEVFFSRSFTQLTCIALDVEEGFLYMGDYGDKMIFRTTLDASDTTSELVLRRVRPNEMVIVPSLGGARSEGNEKHICYTDEFNDECVASERARGGRGIALVSPAGTPSGALHSLWTGSATFRNRRRLTPTRNRSKLRRCTQAARLPTRTTTQTRSTA